MNDLTKSFVKMLATYIDESTMRVLHSTTPWKLPPLLLIGSEDSIFFKSVKKKFDLYNVPCIIRDHFVQPCGGVIIDNDNIKDGIGLSEELDIDCMYHNGMSCVSYAIFTLIEHSAKIDGAKITIVGRGHAVKNLKEFLESRGANVVVAHSKTEDMYKATSNKDIVVYATPRLTQEIAHDTHELVIDLSDCVPYPKLLNCPYVNRIGTLTTSIILNRYVRSVV